MTEFDMIIDETDSKENVTEVTEFNTEHEKRDIVSKPKKKPKQIGSLSIDLRSYIRLIYLAIHPVDLLVHTSS